MTAEAFLDEWSNASDRILVHTSGSTGQPKPLWVEKRRMEASARITCDFLGLQPGDTALLCMSPDYIGGKMMIVRALVRHLQLFTVPPSGHPLSAESLSACAQFQALPDGIDSPITFAAMVPLQVYNTLQQPDERRRLMQVRHLIIGGGAIDSALAAELRLFPYAVWSTYGMTETLSHIALRRLNGPEASDSYRPFPSVHVSLSADGCLVIDAPAVCDAPVVTNDVAELLPDGSFRILGRRDNVICSGGIKIQAEQVERQLQPWMKSPFLITKRDDAKFGQLVVLLTEGNPAEAQAVCERVLAKYHRPRIVLHVSRIPLTPTGKPARKQAEQLAQSAF